MQSVGKRGQRRTNSPKSGDLCPPGKGSPPGTKQGSPPGWGSFFTKEKQRSPAGGRHAHGSARDRPRIPSVDSRPREGPQAPAGGGDPFFTKGERGSPADGWPGRSAKRKPREQSARPSRDQAGVGMTKRSLPTKTGASARRSAPATRPRASRKAPRSELVRTSPMGRPLPKNGD